MKKILFIALSLIFLLQTHSYAAGTQPRPAYLDEPAKLEIIGDIREGEKYPLVIFLPFTSGSADGYFLRVGPNIGLAGYFALIPQGTAQSGDYLPDFYSYIGWYEKRLMTDIKEILNKYPVDPRKIYINGYSLGGDLSWALMIRQKELLAGALIIGSRCSYVPNNKELKYLKEHKKRIVFLMGDTDEPARANGMLNASKLAEKNSLTYWHWKFGGGHVIPDNDMKRAYDLLMEKNDNMPVIAAVPVSGARAKAAADPIIVYGKDTCGLSRAMRKNLDQAGIAYTFYDVDVDKSKSSEMWQKIRDSFPDTKNVTFPIVDIYGLILISPSLEELIRYI